MDGKHGECSRGSGQLVYASSTNSLNHDGAADNFRKRYNNKKMLFHNSAKQLQSALLANYYHVYII